MSFKHFMNIESYSTNTYGLGVFDIFYDFGRLHSVVERFVVKIIVFFARTLVNGLEIVMFNRWKSSLHFLKWYLKEKNAIFFLLLTFVWKAPYIFCSKIFSEQFRYIVWSEILGEKILVLPHHLQWIWWSSDHLFMSDLPSADHYM